jgi:hypothetical protein
MKEKVLAAVTALLMVSTGYAALVVDQEQTWIDVGSSGEGFLVGSASEYQLAQIVTAGLNGRLTRIEIPVVCESGTLIIEIRNVVEGTPPGTPGLLIPGPTLLTRGAVDASEVPPSGGFVFRPVDLDRAVRMSAGERFAIVLKNETGRCGVGMGSWMDLYPRGHSVWRYMGTASGVWLGTGGLSDPIDTAFRTFVETGPGGPPGYKMCTVTGFHHPVPIPSFAPLCRCVEDASLRETRCGFFHPSMFLYRTLPSPISPGQPFTVTWTFIPLSPVTGFVEVTDNLPPGFAGMKSPLVFDGGQVPVGESLSLTYEAAAGTKRGMVETRVVLVPDQGDPEEGKLQTVINVAR